jgi:hypothetical protein
MEVAALVAAEKLVPLLAVATPIPVPQPPLTEQPVDLDSEKPVPVWNTFELVVEADIAAPPWVVALELPSETPPVWEVDSVTATAAKPVLFTALAVPPAVPPASASDVTPAEAITPPLETALETAPAVALFCVLATAVELTWKAPFASALATAFEEHPIPETRQAFAALPENTPGVPSPTRMEPNESVGSSYRQPPTLPVGQPPALFATELEDEFARLFSSAWASEIAVADDGMPRELPAA